VAVARIGEPRRHLAGLNGDLHGLGPGANLLVVEHGEWAGFARAVADLAFFLDDGSDVFRVGGRVGGFAVVRRPREVKAGGSGEDNRDGAEPEWSFHGGSFVCG